MGLWSHGDRGSELQRWGGDGTGGTGGPPGRPLSFSGGLRDPEGQWLRAVEGQWYAAKLVTWETHVVTWDVTWDMCITSV